MMYKIIVVFLVAVMSLTLAANAVAQGKSPPKPQKPVRPVMFMAILSGDEEVPPVDTNARGVAQFKLSKDGTELHYKLIVANIENVTMAHIHMAPSGANGPVVVWLYPSGPPPMLIPGRTNGILAEGVITEDDLVGPLAGGELMDLLAEMAFDNTYVNVHTSQFPGGEIRGQIRLLGPDQDFDE